MYNDPLKYISLSHSKMLSLIMPCIMKYPLVRVLGVMFQISLCVLMKSDLGCLNPRNIVVFVLNPCLNT